MAGYIGTKAVNLSTTGADINGNANVDGTLDVTGAFTSLGIDDNAAATAVTIDASGNVGIGTTDPTAKLEVSDTASKPVIRLEWDEANTDQSEVDRAQLLFVAKNVSGSARGWGMSGYTTDLNSSFKAGLRFECVVGAVTTEVARFDVGGNLLVGTTNSIAYSTSTTSGVTVTTNGSVNGSVESSRVANFNRRTTTGDNVAFRYNGTIVGTVSVTGSATAYNTSSDYRLKENITPVQGAADIVKAMQPVTYTFKSDGSWHDGFLAHELQELHPRAVTGSKDAVDEEGNPEYQGVDYSKLTPILTAALQEALNKIDALEAQNAAFEARLTALEATP